MLQTFFSLEVNSGGKKTDVVMHLTCKHVTTETLPRTYKVLKQVLPSIFKTTCFNDNEFSFATEVKNTEIGHLFEHIIITYLCEISIELENCNVIFNGETSWNWNKEPLGTYHITFNVGKKDTLLFLEALTLSISLIEFILQQETIQSPATPKMPLFAQSFKLSVN